MPRNYTPKKLPTKLEVVDYCRTKAQSARARKTVDETVEQQMLRLTEMEAYEDVIAFIEGRRDDTSR